MMLTTVVLLAAALAQTDVRSLTLEDAVRLALEKNSQLKLARLSVSEHEKKAAQVRALQYPQLKSETFYAYTTELQRLQLPGGFLGTLPSLGPIPPEPLTVFQGTRNYLLSTNSLGQPTTQLVKIRAGIRAAEAEKKIAETRVRQGENELVAGVHQLFFGLLISGKQREAAKAKVALAEEQLKDAREAVASGNALGVAAVGREAGLLEARHGLMASEDRIADLTQELNEVLGLPLATRLELIAPAAGFIADTARSAAADHPQVRAADLTIERARHGLTAARAEYLPEITLLAQHIYQHGVPFLPGNSGVFGARASWEVLEFGRRGNQIAERKIQIEQAEENARHTRVKVALETEKARRKLTRTQEMLDVARTALKLRREQERLARDQQEAGVALASAVREAEAARANAEADALAAELGCRLAQVELDRAAGSVPVR